MLSLIYIEQNKDSCNMSTVIDDYFEINEMPGYGRQLIQHVKDNM